MNDGNVTRHVAAEASDRGRITAISTTPQRQPITVLLGMHRSGTSLCSHVLSVLGLDMADVMFPSGSETAGPDNARGHWERWEIVGFHDRVLAHFNRGYFGPFHDLPLPAGWWADPKIAAIRREMVGFLEKRMRETRFGFKDPRTIRLLPLWYQVFDDLRLAPKIVLCLRDPAEVARSLAARDGLDPAMGEHRWLVHMMDFFRYVGEHDYCTVEYERWFDDPRANVAKLRKFLALDWQQSERELDLTLSGIVDPTLRHDGRRRSSTSLILAGSLYKLVARAEHDAAAREQIQQITAQFLEFQQAEAGFQQAFENASAAAAKLPQAEQQAAESQAALADREAAAEAAQAALAVREAAAEAAQAELATAAAALQRTEEEAAGLRAALAERDTGLAAAEERMAAAEQQATGLQAALAEHETRVAAAEMRAAAEQEIAALRAALAERDTGLQAALAERETGLAASDERAAAAESEAAALRAALAQVECAAAERGASLAADLTGLREALARNEDEARERAAAEYTLRGEVLALQKGIRRLERQEGERADALARAQREAAEGAHAAEALRGEIAALQQQLAELRIDQAAPANAAPAELAEIRAALARAEAQLRERDATAEAARSEMAALRAQVDAARQVGARLVAAFRADILPAPEPLPARPGGWRAAFGFLRLRRAGAAAP